MVFSIVSGLGVPHLTAPSSLTCLCTSWWPPAEYPIVGDAQGRADATSHRRLEDVPDRLPSARVSDRGHLFGGRAVFGLSAGVAREVMLASVVSLVPPISRVT